MTRIMKRILPLIILIGGVGLFAMAFMFYQKSESLKKETEILRELTEPTTDHNVDEPYEPTPEPEYDPTDIDQTPPGVTPFSAIMNVCFIGVRICDNIATAEIMRPWS